MHINANTKLYTPHDDTLLSGGWFIFAYVMYLQVLSVRFMISSGNYTVIKLCLIPHAYMHRTIRQTIGDMRAGLNTTNWSAAESVRRLVLSVWLIFVYGKLSVCFIYQRYIVDEVNHRLTCVSDWVICIGSRYFA